MLREKPPPGHGGGFSEMSSAGCLDNSENSRPLLNRQDKNRASEFTCASQRAAELRDCLVREIIRAAAIGMQAQAALLDGDDEAALGHLRRHWIVMRADVAPMAAELGLLREAP